ncbi:MAG: Uma2 family endonuclease [Acidobacteriota bacterium]|nr:Uma2 family endonuclease [Acidobacteriota bacterium]
MALPKQIPTYAPEDYLALERLIDERHEYLDGIVYLMAGESLNHSRICINLAREVSNQLKGRDCEALSSNMKVCADSHGLFAYPDLTVVCGKPRFLDEQRDVLLNPTVIFEVLSPSTAAYDRGEKFQRYSAQIETLQDYVLIAQDTPHVELRSRQPDGTWSRAEVSELTATLELTSIDCHLPLAEIYDRIEFTE